MIPNDNLTQASVPFSCLPAGLCPHKLFVELNDLKEASCQTRNYTVFEDSTYHTPMCDVIQKLFYRMYKKPGMCDCDCGCCRRSGGADTRHCCGGSMCGCC